MREKSCNYKLDSALNSEEFHATIIVKVGAKTAGVWRPTCRDAGALLRAEAGHGAAARRTSSGALDVQLSVVVTVISNPGPVHGLNPGGRRSASGRVQSVVVGVDRVREAGGQHHRAAPVQQQRLLAARPAGQDAVYAEHPGGHHTGARRLGNKTGRTGRGEKCSVR